MVAVERGVDLAQQVLALGVGGADDDAVGAHAVGDRGALLQELRVGDHVEAEVAEPRAASVSASLARTLSAVPTGTVDLVTTTLGSAMCVADGGGDLEHVAQIRRAVLVGRGADGDEDDPAVRHALGGIGGEAEPAGGGVRPHQIVEPGLVDRDAPGLQRLDLGGVDVDAEHLVADLRQHGPLDQADVAGTEDGDPHPGNSLRVPPTS